MKTDKETKTVKETKKAKWVAPKRTELRKDLPYVATAMTMW